MTPLLLLCGVTAVALGTWRGYVNAREALGPVVHDGEPTRTAIEAARPLLQRTRVRRFLRGLAASLAWLAVAMYGLFLVSAAEVPVSGSSDSFVAVQSCFSISDNSRVDQSLAQRVPLICAFFLHLGEV